jgi:hypothetical protein
VVEIENKASTILTEDSQDDASTELAVVNKKFGQQKLQTLVVDYSPVLFAILASIGVAWAGTNIVLVISFLHSIVWLMSHLAIDHLSDLAVFYATILSVAVPLAFSVSSQMSDRYKSDIVTKEFAGSKVTRSFIFLLFLNVLILLPFALFGKFTELHGYHQLVKVFSFFSLPMFVSILILFALQMKDILALYNAESLVSRLNTRLTKLIAKRQTNNAGRTLEAVADILSVELERKKSAFVRTYLRPFTDGCIELARLEEAHWQTDALRTSQTKEQKFFIGFNYQFRPEILTPGLDTALKQLARIFQSAVDIKSPEVARQCANALQRLLNASSKDANHRASVDQALQTILQLIISNKRTDDDRVLLSLINYYRGSLLNSDEIQAVHVELFNSYLTEQLQLFVRDQLFEVARTVLHTLVGGFDHFPISEIDKLVSFKMQHESALTDKVFELMGSKPFYTTLNQLTAADDIIVSFANELKSITNQDSREQLERMEADVERCLVSVYKHHQLLCVIFDFGAYCLYQKRQQFIPQIWYQNQPLDADATWVGSDIIPQNFRELIGIYFGAGNSSHSMSMYDGHHSARPYKEKYFILLLAHMLARGLAQEIEFPSNFNAVLVTEVKQSCSQLRAVAKDVCQQSQLLADVGFTEQDKAKVFDLLLVVTIDELEEKADDYLKAYRREGPLDRAKIAKLESEIERSFSHYVTMPPIFAKYKKLISSCPEWLKPSRFIWSKTLDRAAFLENWNVGYSMHFGIIARDAASAFQRHLLRKMIESGGSIKHAGEKFEFRAEDQAILLGTDDDLKQFISCDFDCAEEPDYFVCSTEIGGNPIGVHLVYDKILEGSCLLLSLDQFGYLLVSKQKLVRIQTVEPVDDAQIRVSIDFSYNRLSRHLGSRVEYYLKKESTGEDIVKAARVKRRQ